jgi:hypothetical protein
MKVRACAIAVLCLASHASQAAESEWLPSAPASLGSRATWQALPVGAFAEVAVSKLALAQAILSDRSFAPRSAREVESLLGRPGALTCLGGAQPYLVRAVYGGAGEFSLLWSADTLVVAHGSLGAGGKNQASAIVACLTKAPAAVVSVVGGAI